MHAINRRWIVAYSFFVTTHQNVFHKKRYRKKNFLKRRKEHDCSTKGKQLFVFRVSEVKTEILAVQSKS